MSDAEWSQEFVSAFAGFSAALSESKIAIYSIDYDFEVFGCWTIEIGTRHNRLKISWDGRESVMSCYSARKSDSHAAKEWKFVSEDEVQESSSSEAVFSAAKKLTIHLAAT